MLLLSIDIPPVDAIPGRPILPDSCLIVQKLQQMYCMLKPSSGNVDVIENMETCPKPPLRDKTRPRQKTTARERKEKNMAVFGINGRCAINDDLSPILKKIDEQAEAIILGTPIYFGSITGEMRSFLERLLFPHVRYTQPFSSTFPRKIRTAVIYTMNATEKMSHERGYEMLYSSTEAYLRMVFGAAETFCCYDTYQFPDYSKVIMEYMDPAKKAERRKTVFPDDCRKAFELGCRIYSNA